MQSMMQRISVRLLSALLTISCALVGGLWAQTPPSPPKTDAPAAAAQAAVPSPVPAQAKPETGDKKGWQFPDRVDSKGVPLYETIQEDWSSLQIGVSQLKPEEPMVGQVEEHETFNRILVEVKWRPGDPIDLWIVLPKGVKKPPAVLYVYNFTEDTDKFKDDGWCERATRGGVAAVGFVSALSGERFHDRPMQQWFVSELQESIGSTVHDVHLVLDYLAQRGEVDMNRIGIFGEGSGGTIAILAAAADSRIQALDVLEPWGDWPDFLAKSVVVLQDPRHADYAKPDFLKRVAPLDPVQWLPQMKTPHIRVQQVIESRPTPVESKDKLKDALPKQAELVRFQRLYDLSQKEGQGGIFEWIKLQAQGAQPSGGKDTHGSPVAHR